MIGRKSAPSRREAFGAAALGLLMSGLLASTATAADMTQNRLENPEREPQNWILHHKNYSSHRYSTLDQINKTSVKNLKLAYAFSLGGIQGGGRFSNAALEATPLVEDGFMYVPNGWGEVSKLDLRQGYAKSVWKTDPGVDKPWAADVACCDIDNRGVALWKDKVISIALDGRMFAINKETGETVWEAKVADPAIGETITVAPLVVRDVAISGVSGAELGIRGWLAGINLNTGKEQWKRFLTPKPGEPGSETWADNHNGWANGGASTWETGSFDPALNLVYWGTGNPGPDFDPEYRPGDNLYSDSVVAVSPDDGTIKWYFQYTPNDPHDHDEISDHPLIDIEVNGQMRKMVVHAARNGFFYGFDRASGEYIYGKQYLDTLTWTKGLDPKTGRPLEYNPALKVQTYAGGTTGLRGKPATEDVCPSTTGGKNWPPTAYNPTLKLIYIPSIEMCGRINPKEQTPPVEFGGTWKPRDRFTGAGDIQIKTLYGAIKSVNVMTGDVRSRLSMPYPMWSGMLATAGGIVVTSTVDGWVLALDADTLQELWKINMGTGFNAPAMTYAVDGKQYIAVLAGSIQAAPYRGNGPAQKGMSPTSMLFVFSL
jgi:alcohol dehydrogenase (cytochrome c)